MKYKAILTLHYIDFKNYRFEALASTAQAAINKVRKQAIKKGFNALNSHGDLSVFKRKYSKYDDNNYYYVNTILAWN